VSAPKFVTLTDTLCQGVIVAWWETSDGNADMPLLWPTAAEAQVELDECYADLVDQVADGEREPDDLPDKDETWVAACLVHDDGAIEILQPDGSPGPRWTLAELRALAGR
jgi:hypothetical protein